MFFIYIYILSASLHHSAGYGGRDVQHAKITVWAVHEEG